MTGGGFLARLRADQAGMSAVEFGFIAPAFLVLLMGSADVAQMVYARALLNGATEQAARMSQTETADLTVAQNLVQSVVLPVTPGGTITPLRTSYQDFTDVGRAEKWTDTNGNGVCDNRESYVDENGNGQWDADIGVNGNGGADDVVVLTETLSYQPTFRIPFMPNMWQTFNIVARSVKKNQPFQSQTGYQTTTGIC